MSRQPAPDDPFVWLRSEFEAAADAVEGMLERVGLLAAPSTRRLIWRTIRPSSG